MHGGAEAYNSSSWSGSFEAARSRQNYYRGLHMDKVRPRGRFAPKLISLAVASCFATGAAMAAQPVLPTGGIPVAGIQSITQVDRTLNVLTNAQKSIAYWNSFSIGRDAAVRV